MEEKRKKVIIISTALLVVIAIIAIILLPSTIQKNNSYNTALSLMEYGKYEEALMEFIKLGKYRDSEDKILECKYNQGVKLFEQNKYADAMSIFAKLNGESYAKSIKQYTIQLLKKASVGSTVFLGTYEQDNNTSNGKEAIQWRVISMDKNNNKILVTSEYALDCKPYHTEHVDITWENCYLRNWLNNDFFNAAFNSVDKTLIPTATVTAYNQFPASTGGNDTQDNVFLLSLKEIESYLDYYGISGKCKATPYAIGQGVNVDESEICDWWLRSPGHVQTSASGINKSGNTGGFLTGNVVECTYFGVRPCIWIDLSSI